MNVLAVALGGALGSALRYLSGHVAVKVFGLHSVFGTLMVNCIGCFLIGFLSDMMGFSSLNTKTKAFIFIGILGGFTTFSTYAFEIAEFIREDKVFYSICYAIGNVILCIALVFLGIAVSKFFKTAIHS